MVSINSAANTYILSNLRQINNDIATTQTRIGTGKKVNSSSDNASVWATAQSIRSDQSAANNLTSGISVAKARSDTAVAALDTVVNLLGQIKTLALDAAANTPSSYTAVNAKITALKTQITATVSGATFEGQNFLNTAAATGGTVTVGIAGGTTQTVAVTTVDQSGGAITTFAAIAAISDATTAGTLSTGVDTAVATLSAYQATLSTFSSSLGLQQDFQKSLSNIRSATLSSLVDADLTEESAKVTALQTQQQLAYQALSISNSSASNILALFR